MINQFKRDDAIHEFKIDQAASQFTSDPDHSPVQKA
jgi:hypothetical protein